MVRVTLLVRQISRARRFLTSGRVPFCAGALSMLFLVGCADMRHQIVISVPEQRMLLLDHGQPVAVYPVSTSKFGTGDFGGTGQTPLGELEIAAKIGTGFPQGTVLKSRRRTGEVVSIDAPGRDAIVTRILWLRGLEAGNDNAYRRFIYIHGTPEERNIGKPVSYGCVRMRSRDVVNLFDFVGKGAKVYIRNQTTQEAAAPLLAPGASLLLLGPPPSTPMKTESGYSLPAAPNPGRPGGPAIIPPGGETFSTPPPSPIAQRRKP